MDCNTGDKNACMPNAVNNYFGHMVFQSLVHFQSGQRAVCVERHISIQGDLDVDLMRFIQVGRHVYCRHNVYSTAWQPQREWDGCLGQQRDRLIVHYQPNKDDELHAHFGRLEGGHIWFRHRQAWTKRLPFCGLTAKSYLEKALKPGAAAWRYMCLFIYIRQ
jgi:hypothetical protein